MVLNGLKILSSSMRNRGIERYRFEYKSGRLTFDVFYFIDGQPYILLFGVRSQNFSFEFEVDQTFSVIAVLDKAAYRKLCSLLELKFDPNNRFSPKSFLQEFDRHIPANADPTQIAKPHEIIRYRSDVEEGEKMWFCAWRDNTLRGQCVTAENLRKTRLLLGERIYFLCKEKNVSSCWTDDPSRSTFPQANVDFSNGCFESKRI